MKVKKIAAATGAGALLVAFGAVLTPTATAAPGTAEQCAALYKGTVDSLKAYTDCRFDGPPVTPSPTPTPTPSVTAPAGTTVTVSDVTATSVKVNWTAVAGATGYYVERDGKDAREPNGPTGWGTTDPADARSRVFDNLVPGGTYTFSVTPKPGDAKVSKTVTLPGASTSPSPTPTVTTPPAPGDTSPGWLSGAAGPNAANGSFGTWRGSPIEIGGTWVNDPALFPLQNGAEWGAWKGPMDVGAVPANWQGWAAEANGASDAFWTALFRNMKTLRAGEGTTYVRPWYEYNGTWMNYSVRNDTDRDNLLKAWARVDAIQNREFPEAKMMLGTSAANGYSVANSYPASGVDLLSIDFYNNWPWCTTTACFNDKIENAGGANSLADLTRLAASKGDAVMISEWSNQGQVRPASNGGGGESPQFMRDWNAWLRANAGTAPGKVTGEVLFDLWPAEFQIYKTTVQPATAEEYRRLW